MGDSPMSERWLPVVGAEGRYEVSDLGRVRSVPRVVTDRRGQVHRIKQQVKELSPGYAGYILATLYLDGRKRWKVRVHTLVLGAFVGPPPAGMECLHGDGNPANNKLSNLSWGTSSANKWDRVRHGNHPAKNRTHCPRRHGLREPNLKLAALRRGFRACQACALANAQVRYATKMGRHLDLDVEADDFYRRIMSGEWVHGSGRKAA